MNEADISLETMIDSVDDNRGFPAVAAGRKTGDERFVSKGEGLSATLSDFWRWSVSNLVSNATRGILAEFIVANALQLDSGIRTEWDAYDLKLSDGTKLEIKSAAYCQSWMQTKLSQIRFTIRPTYGWDSSTNIVSTALQRQADIYVFCLLKHQEKTTVNPLDLDQWEFYLTNARKLNERFPNQKSIGLSGLLKLGPIIVKYGELATKITQMANERILETP